MTRAGLIAIWVIVAAWIALEVFVTIHYSRATDTVFANVSLLIYALIAVGVVCAIDAGARKSRRTRSRYR